MQRHSETAESEGLEVLGRGELDAASLWQTFPPRIAHPAKQQVLELAGGLARVPRGTLRVARYACLRLPEVFPDAPPSFRNDLGAFDYAPPPANTCEWHVNFADPYLFFAYGAAAFAQDEIQVAEHPVLGSLREALEAEQLPGIPPLTSDGERPTPILMRGVERCCAIDLDPDLAMPYGIYGRRFQVAKPAVLEQAVTRVAADHFTNLLAMAAPRGSGRYTARQIELILETAWVGFRAARLESDAGQRVVVHSGHWGTGAFGGNRQLMAIVQIMAARLARLDELAYHSLDNEGLEAAEEGARVAADLLAASASASVADVIQRVAALGLHWGASDGN